METVEISESTVNPSSEKKLSSENFELLKTIGRGGYGKGFTYIAPSVLEEVNSTLWCEPRSPRKRFMRQYSSSSRSPMVTEELAAQGVSAISQSRLNGQAGNFEEMDTSSTSCGPNRSRPNSPSPSEPVLGDVLRNAVPFPVGPSVPPQLPVCMPSEGPCSNCSSPLEIPRSSSSSPSPWLNIPEEPSNVRQSSPVDIPKRRNGKGRSAGLAPLASDSVSGSVSRRKGKRNGRKN